jgi:intein/homing endonuclease
VLSQNPESGELGLKVVRAVTRRENAPMQTLVVSKTRLTLTTGHPLWVNGAGWRMAKKLKLGDSLHTIRGSTEVERLERAGAGRAYNLVIDDFGSYFVTELGVLAHDNTYRKPTRAVSPGLLARNEK